MVMDNDFPALSSEEPSSRYSSSMQNWYNYRTNILHLGDHPDQNVRGRLFQHELSHFGLHCSTPYGLVLDDLNHLQTTSVIGFCQRFEVDLEGQKIPRPIYPFVRKYGMDLETLEKHFPRLTVITSLAYWFIRPWALGALLESLLEGTDRKSSIDLTDKDAIGAVESYESFFVQGFHVWPIKAEPLTATALFDDQEESDLDESSSVKTNDKIMDIGIPVAPRWDDRAEGALFGGFHIFEGVAQLIEGHHGEGFKALFGSPAALSYIRLWALMIEKYDREIKTKEEYQAVAATFFAICELALYIPIGPVYGRLRTHQTTWLDIQPGYRIVRALDEVDKVGLLRGFEDNLDAFQAKLCHRLNWPEPAAFLDIGTCLKPIRPSYARHRAACQMRKSEPWIFIQRLAESDAFQTFFREYAPMLTVGGKVMGWNVVSVIQQFCSTVSWRLMMRSGQLQSKDLLANYEAGKDMDHAKLLDMMYSTFRCFREERFRVLELP